MFPHIGVAAGLATMAGLNLPLAAFLTAVSVRLDLAGFGTTFPGLAPFGSTYFLAIAGVLAVIEFIIDRIPRLDSVWDFPNTLFRPAGAGVGVFLLFAPRGTAAAIIAASLAAGAALAVHLSKSAFRIRLNRAGGVSKNVFASNAEDGFVIGIAALMTYFPQYSLALTIPVIAAAGWLVPKSHRTLRPGKAGIPPGEEEA